MNEKLEMQISEAKNEGVKAVGLLLTEICKISAQAAELIEQDLENKSMSIQKCYDALYAHAKKHQTKGCWACPVFGIDPENEAVKVILEFYGVPAEWITTPGYTESQALGRAFARDPSPRSGPQASSESAGGAFIAVGCAQLAGQVGNDEAGQSASRAKPSREILRCAQDDRGIAAQDDRGIATRAGRIDSFDLLDLL